MALMLPWCQSGHTTAVLISKSSGEGALWGDLRVTSSLLKVLLPRVQRPLRAEYWLQVFAASSSLPGCRILSWTSRALWTVSL
jgi:hypothetical protein